MRALVVIVVLLAAAAAAWLLREHWWPAPAPPTVAGADRAPAASSASGREAASSAGRTKTPATEREREPATVEQQAERYVAELTEPEPEPVRVERADHFVTGDQVLSLVPESKVEETTVDALVADPELEPDTPITVVREVEQVERTTPEKLIADSGGDLDAPIQVLEDNRVRETTVREVLADSRREPDRPINVVKQVEYYEQTTPRELAERARSTEGSSPDEPIKVIRQPHGLEVVSVEDLMRNESIASDSLFYVRTVRAGDEQGIWGIVHDGIIENFARGMAIRRGREINTYRVDIPRDADERREDRSSSYLGKLIHEKSKASFVYNFNRRRMGRNPDRIYPGQEIVIIDFRPDELIDIYKHFVSQRG